MASLKTTQLTRIEYRSDTGDTLQFTLDPKEGCEVRITSLDSHLSMFLSPAEVADLVSTLTQNVLRTS